MAFLTSVGKKYVADIISGVYNTALAGINKIGVYGSVSGAADALIGSLQDINFSNSGIAGGFFATLYLDSGESDPIFTISADTVVKGFVLYSTDIGTTFGTHEVALEDFTNETFIETGTLTIEQPVVFLNATNATLKGSNQICKCLAGDYSATGYGGYDKVAIYGSVAGAADALIGTVSTISWGTATSDGAVFSAAKDFTIASANTVIKKVLLFDSVNVGSTVGDETASETFATYYTYEAPGTFRLATFTYKFV